MVSRGREAELQLEKIRLRRMNEMRRQRKSATGPTVVMMIGWTIVLLSIDAFLLTDWHYAVSGLVLGAGEFFAGLCWWSNVPEDR